MAIEYFSIALLYINDAASFFSQELLWRKSTRIKHLCICFSLDWEFAPVKFIILCWVCALTSNRNVGFELCNKILLERSFSIYERSSLSWRILLRWQKLPSVVIKHVSHNDEPGSVAWTAKNAIKQKLKRILWENSIIITYLDYLLLLSLTLFQIF